MRRRDTGRFQWSQSICSRCTSLWRDFRPSYGSRSHCSNVDFLRSYTTRSRTSTTLAASIPETPRFQRLRASARFWRWRPSSSVALTRMIPLLHRVAIANRTVDAQALASLLLPDKHRPPQWLDPRLSDSRTSNDRKRSNRALLRHATSRVSSGPAVLEKPEPAKRPENPPHEHRGCRPSTRLR